MFPNDENTSLMVCPPFFVAFIPALSVSKDKKIRFDLVYLESNLTCSWVKAVPQDATQFLIPWACEDITSKYHYIIIE